MMWVKEDSSYHHRCAIKSCLEFFTEKHSDFEFDIAINTEAQFILSEIQDEKFMMQPFHAFLVAINFKI